MHHPAQEQLHNQLAILHNQGGQAMLAPALAHAAAGPAGRPLPLQGF